MSDAVVARWDGFLAQIKQRFDQVMVEAHQGCMGLLHQTDFNSVAMGNAWSAMERRAKELSTKVDETWRSAVETKFEESGASQAVVERERKKGADFRFWLDNEIERNRIALYNEASRALMGEAQRAVGDGFKCTQCGAALPVKLSFRAVSAKCGHCGAVSTCEPGMHMRMVEAMGVHAMCEQAAWEEWLVWQNAERAWKAARPETYESIERVEKALIAYWTRYLRHRAELMPETAAAFDKDLSGKLAYFYQGLAHNKAWLSVRRPG